MRRARRQHDGAAGVGQPQQRIDRADQPPGRGDVDGHHLLEDFRLDMADRRDDAEHAGIGDEYVELAPALVDGAAQPVDAGHVGEVERHQRRLALAGPGALGLDLVVELLQPADRARHRDDMRAGRRHVPGDEIADAARSAGDQRDAAGEVGSHRIFLAAF